MKKVVLLAALLGLLVAAAGFAQERPLSIRERDFGFGFIFGEPTGVNAKLWIGRFTALDVTGAWSFIDEGRFVLHIDYLYHLFNLFRVGGGGQLPFYIGIGPRLFFAGENPHVGVRAPVGASYMFPTIPIELFAEIAPGISVIPDTSFDISGGFGVRYYF